MIELKNVSYWYNNADSPAVEDVSIHVKAGEFVLLCGRSGCGKTTVTRLINGLIPHFNEGKLEGKVLIDDLAVDKQKVQDIANSVGSVFQDPRSQFFTTNTTTELSFFAENLGLPSIEIAQRVSTTVTQLNLESLLERSLFNLSSGEKQKIAIGSVYTALPKIYVLDEPSANLDHASIEDLKFTLSLLKSKGYTIIISEHRLYYLMDLIDRVIYMDAGKIEKEWTKEAFKEMTADELGHLGLRSIKYILRLHNTHNHTISSINSKIMMRDVSFKYKSGKKVISSFNMLVQAGEIIGITGLNGAGKSTLARVICGLCKEQSGTIMLNGSRANKTQRINNAYLVMQDADYQLFTDSVEEELMLGNEKKIDLGIKVEEILTELNLLDFKDRHPASLSGGQKQRVTIGVAMVSDKEVIVLDEPTSGLDAYNMRKVASMLKRMTNQGKTLLVITHDQEFINECCHRTIELIHS